MTVQATGTPKGYTFDLTSTPVSGTLNAGIKYPSGTIATPNPNTIQLTEPRNNCSLGKPGPGGLEKIEVTYGPDDNTKASKDFSVPTFGMSCYYTALESDWLKPDGTCNSVTIENTHTHQRTTYSGMGDPNPPMLKGQYCNAFLAEMRLQGSGTLDSGQNVQYDRGSGRYIPVTDITVNGHKVESGKTLARDPTIIPKSGTSVELDGYGDGLSAIDSGNGIVGYRLDIYEGPGRAACGNYKNVMAVGACSPVSTTCPGKAIK